jgi:hypothetical protein
MNDEQLDANKIIQSLLRQVSEYAQKVAILEAYIETHLKETQEKTQ